jgi:hypothetical protein
MRAGASLEVASYSTLAEDLASHGYFVVGVDAPYRTGIVAFPDGRVIKRTSENNPEFCLERTGGERGQCANRFLTNVPEVSPASTITVASVITDMVLLRSGKKNLFFR